MQVVSSHSPQGECGLKQPVQAGRHRRHQSLPARGVWIETTAYNSTFKCVGSLPARGVWIETIRSFHRPVSTMSLPARGVWIETTISIEHEGGMSGHSPQGECGLKLDSFRDLVRVRGHSPQGECGLKYVVLRQAEAAVESLPARGVWIEIPSRGMNRPATAVTPRKGSVD